MNIFILSEDPKENARFHADKHVVKMILEHIQILSTIIQIQSPNTNVYKPTHRKHPCTIWASESINNYLYLIELTEALHEEYLYRYNKIHKSMAILEYIKNNLPELPDIPLTPFAQAMPDVYKNKSAVTAYQTYYINEKQHLFSWKNRDIPSFIKESK